MMWSEYSAHSFPSFRSGKADQIILATKDKIRVGFCWICCWIQGSSVQRLESCHNYSDLLYYNSNFPTLEGEI